MQTKQYTIGTKRAGKDSGKLVAIMYVGKKGLQSYFKLSTKFNSALPYSVIQEKYPLGSDLRHYKELKSFSTLLPLSSMSKACNIYSLNGWSITFPKELVALYI